LNISQQISKEFLAQIFGCQIGTHFEADDKSKSKGLQKVQAKWNTLCVVHLAVILIWRSGEFCENHQIKITAKP